jgi:hypothetical protein
MGDTSRRIPSPSRSDSDNHVHPRVYLPGNRLKKEFPTAGVPGTTGSIYTVPFESDGFVCTRATWHMCMYNAYQVSTASLIEIFSEPALLNQR